MVLMLDFARVTFSSCLLTFFDKLLIVIPHPTEIIPHSPPVAPNEAPTGRPTPVKPVPIPLPLALNTTDKNPVAAPCFSVSFDKTLIDKHYHPNLLQVVLVGILAAALAVTVVPGTNFPYCMDRSF